MPRIALGVEYDGSDFVGWQPQHNGRSVATDLAAAVSAVADETVQVHAAGRTDAGVHATGQVVHFDTRATRSARAWALGINSNLPPDIAIAWAREVPADFDARRSAIARRYRYVIACSPTRPAVARRFVWWLRDALDCPAMSHASIAWLGEHDFSAFRAAECQSSTPMRHIYAIGIARHDERVEIEVTANSFVYHMVRNLVGALAEIGRGRAPPAWAEELLAGRDRTKGAPTAPAHGLTLVGVYYPEKLGLPCGSGLQEQFVGAALAATRNRD
jgi:tRNA pseudouridine38-40 synthase